MIKVLLVLHVFVTIALIGVVLIQRSEGGGLGLGGGQGMGSFMTGRGTANLLTRATAILGTVFFINSLVLAMHFKGAASSENAAILNSSVPAAPASAPAQPAQPAGAPSVPLPSSLPATPADALPAPAAPSAPAAPAAP
ncbi:preprotein translocase subunit SecG [Acidocella sp.]|uniref:preprotein translocase subunit SecG n=1 Tax=Acidocella sp. TaxID=50710 RepID=UPI0026386ED0|nr:preprotein translocase subunit SecG [Acidocella sp.]